MSTLSLADLGSKMRLELGLDASTDCTTSTIHQLARVDKSVVAIIPIIDLAGPVSRKSPIDDSPGAAWLRTGLHRLRLPKRDLQSSITPVI